MTVDSRHNSTVDGACVSRLPDTDLPPVVVAVLAVECRGGGGAPWRLADMMGEMKEYIFGCGDGMFAGVLFLFCGW